MLLSQPGCTLCLSLEFRQDRKNLQSEERRKAMNTIIRQVQRDSNEQQDLIAVTPQGIQVHLAQGLGITL